MLSLFPQLLDFQFFGPLLLRIVLGVIFIVHGYPKLFKSFGATTQFFESIGIKPAKFWVLVVGLTEFLGGIFLVAGFLVQAVAILATINMFVAIWKVKRKQGFYGGYEFELTLLVIALSLLILGPGAYAIDLPL